MYVIVYHAVLLSWPAKRIPAPMLLSRGRLAVDGFIALSGFCLMLPVARHGNLESAPVFFRRRAIRILPTFYAALVFSLLFRLLILGTQPDGSHGDIELPITPRSVAACLFMVQNLFAVNRINSVFWSIAVEWQIYFLFPLLLLLWKAIGPSRATLLILIGSNTAWWLSRGILNPASM